MRYSGRVPHLIEERLYVPAARLSLLGAAWARRLQSGSLGMYVAYLIGLVLVLLGYVDWPIPIAHPSINAIDNSNTSWSTGALAGVKVYQSVAPIA